MRKSWLTVVAASCCLFAVNASAAPFGPFGLRSAEFLDEGQVKLCPKSNSDCVVVLDKNGRAMRRADIAKFISRGELLPALRHGEEKSRKAIAASGQHSAALATQQLLAQMAGQPPSPALQHFHRSQRANADAEFVRAKMETWKVDTALLIAVQAANREHGPGALSNMVPPKSIRRLRASCAKEKAPACVALDWVAN